MPRVWCPESIHRKHIQRCTSVVPGPRGEMGSGAEPGHEQAQQQTPEGLCLEVKGGNRLLRVVLWLPPRSRWCLLHTRPALFSSMVKGGWSLAQVHARKATHQRLVTIFNQSHHIAITCTAKIEKTGSNYADIYIYSLWEPGFGTWGLLLAMLYC